MANKKPVDKKKVVKKETKKETNKKIDSKNEEISSKQKEIDEIQSKITAKEKEIKETVKLLCDRLREAYIAGNSSTLDLLLSCDDISSFLITAEIIKRLAEYDEKLVDDINKIIASLKEMNEDLEKDKKELVEARAELDTEKAGLMTKLAAQETEMAKFREKQDAITAKMMESQAILNELDETSEAYQRAIERFEQQEAAAESKIQQIINGAGSYSEPSSQEDTPSGGGSSSSEGFICPLPYGDRYVSSRFGYRESFLTDSGQYTGTFHGGTDITCSGGWNYDKKIIASRSGTVICAEWLSGYGNTVMIQHDEVYVTLYAHNYCLLVSYGQYVKQGQQIAIMGSTGNSTGPHCHFEIRKYGEQVDALNYITV